MQTKINVLKICKCSLKRYERFKKQRNTCGKGHAGSYIEALTNGGICTGGHVGWGHLSQQKQHEQKQQVRELRTFQDGGQFCLAVDIEGRNR